MALEEESIVQTWLNGLKTLDVKTKKMFGCYSENRYKYFAPICPFFDPHSPLTSPFYHFLGMILLYCAK
jgi:hypothetical protein